MVKLALFENIDGYLDTGLLASTLPTLPSLPFLPVRRETHRDCSGRRHLCTNSRESSGTLGIILKFTLVLDVYLVQQLRIAVWHRNIIALYICLLSTVNR